MFKSDDFSVSGDQVYRHTNETVIYPFSRSNDTDHTYFPPESDPFTDEDGENMTAKNETKEQVEAEKTINALKRKVNL